MGIALLLASCSKTKFSGFRQYTTNFISYYNTYFNIKQLYKVGYRESVFEKQETSNDIISVFEYENDPQFFEGSAQFKGTTVKVSKLLVLRPYNKWMDDALLIEGKIRYLKGDLDSAVQFLSYLVDYYPKGYMAGHLPGGKLKGFDDMVRQAVRKKEPINQPKLKYKFARNEGIIWLAKAYIKKGSFERALNLIYMAEADMGFPVEYRKDLLKVKTMLAIEKKEYIKATEYLNILINEYKLTKKERGRLYFILGQIKEKEKKYNQASSYFELALANKLKNDLEFEAKLRMLTYASGESSLPELKKMLNKGKYEHSIDKVYFAIANVLIEKKQTKEALEYYQKSIASSKNSNQKFLVYEKVGSIFYEKSDYVLSAQYYDSAQRVIPQNYPNKKDFLKKVEALNKLLVQYNIYISKDSILDLAALGPEKAKEKIEKQIKKAYEEEKAKEMFLESKTLNSQTVASTSMGGGQARQWYFSSKESIDKGRIMFQKKWGKLLLKENWHRSTGGGDNNAASSAPGVPGASANMNESMSTDIVAEVEASKLPFTPEAQKPIKKEIQQALVNMARIYNYEIKDLQKAIETYELLFKKYGKDLENEDEHLYSMFRLYLEKEDAVSAERVKAELIEKYPNSKYTLYALNPNAKSQEEKSDLAVAKLYKEAYLKYQKTFYSEALDMCNNIIESYPDHKLVPKVKLLKAFIYSYTYNSNDYVKALEDIINQHKDADEAKVAKEYLDLHLKLKSEKPAEVFESAVSNKTLVENMEVTKPNISLSQSIEKSKESVSVEDKPRQSLEEEKKEVQATKKEEVNLPKKIEDVKPRTSKETIASENTKKTDDGLQIVNYNFKPDAKHAIIFQLNPDIKASTAKNMLDVYHRANFKSKAYKTEILELAGQQFLTIGNFKTVQDAIEFYAMMQEDALVQKLIYSSTKYYISSENLDILYISSGWEQYLSFYEKNYK
ncbi:MAG: tetratricopeptide repeat protein [Chitinophagales bacterium]|nr:tetratricopeptide repeat protein [Chitinophagales bacterium]